MSETSSQKHDIPRIQSYRDLIKVRSSQVLGLNSNKSTLGLAGQNVIKESDRNIPISKTSKASLVTSLNFDFGTLGEFLNYDMHLKKPDELFRMNAGGKRNDLKNSNQDDWKERLMAKDKQEVEMRPPKQIMLDIVKHDPDNPERYKESDMKKVSKAVKQFIKDMEIQIFGEDIDAIEERVVKKGKNKLSEFLNNVEESDTVKKASEKYAHRPFNERLEYLEKKLDQRHEKQRENMMKQSENYMKQSSNVDGFDRKRRMLNAQRSSMPLDDNHIQPRPSSRASDGSRAQETQHKKHSKLGRIEDDRPLKSHMYVENQRANTMNSSVSPKRTNIVDDKVVYVNKIISISPYLTKFCEKYLESKEKYVKLYDKAIEYGLSDLYDEYQTHKKDDIFYLNDKMLLIANMERDPYTLLHVCISDFSFKNLIMLNLYGSNFPDFLLTLTLMLILRYQPPLKVIDLGGNSISPRCADILSNIISLNELKTLRLSQCGLTTKILSQICIGLAKSNVIEDLDLSQNELDDFGLKSLVLVLKHSTTLAEIDLRTNPKFTDPALQELDHTIRTNKIMSHKNIKIF